MKDNENRTARVSFAALDPYVEHYIPSSKETKYHGSDIVYWGERNAFPDYLLDLYNNVATLGTIINGTVDFIAGDDVNILPLSPLYDAGVMNMKGDEIFQQVVDIARDFLIYGGCAFEVIRGKDGKPLEVYHCDMRYLRTNEENDVFYYSEKWAKGGRDALVMPAFSPQVTDKWDTLDDKEKARHLRSILYIKKNNTQVYPAPVYRQALKSCETERGIDDFHLSSINNDFVASMVVNFNNGQPSDEIRNEVEAMFNEKFSGHQNGGRIVFSWNDNAASRTTFDVPKVEDFGSRYEALAKHTRQQIYAAFRAVPALFGIMTETTGFSDQEFEQAFRLYNRTVVRPIQRTIANAYDRIYGQRGVLNITPFSIDEGRQTDTMVN